MLKRFVGFGLREEHVKMVGDMIVPPKVSVELANKWSGCSPGGLVVQMR